jgi:hypothetical protein
VGDRQDSSKPRVLIVGGGIAGIEALLALRDLAGDRAEATLVAADPDFVYKPLIVEEPFTYRATEHRANSASSPATPPPPITTLSRVPGSSAAFKFCSPFRSPMSRRS